MAWKITAIARAQDDANAFVRIEAVDDMAERPSEDEVEAWREAAALRLERRTDTANIDSLAILDEVPDG